MRVPTILVDYPLCGCIAKNNVKKIKNRFIINAISPLTFKLILLCYRESRITTFDIRQTTTTPASSVIKKVYRELSSIRYKLFRHESRNLFNTSKIKQFGKGLRIEFNINSDYLEAFEPRLRTSFVQVNKSKLFLTSNINPTDILLLLLQSRYQKNNYMEFLMQYFLGVDRKDIDNLDDKTALSTKKKIDRVYNNIFISSRKLGIKFQYNETRIPVGRFTAKWFKSLEFGGNNA